MVNDRETVTVQCKNVCKQQQHIRRLHNAPLAPHINMSSHSFVTNIFDCYVINEYTRRQPINLVIINEVSNIA